MSAVEIINQLPMLTESERRAVLNKLRELAVREEDILLCQQATDEQAAKLGRLQETATAYHTVDLTVRGLGETQAADLRARLKTFAEDWERPEASIYDEDAAR